MHQNYGQEIFFPLKHNLSTDAANTNPFFLEKLGQGVGGSKTPKQSDISYGCPLEMGHNLRLQC